jgi:cytochrome c oxidase subunit IV
MRTITSIWMVLVLLSMFAFLVGWFKITSSFFIALLLLTTFIKGQLVIDYFMDLREVSLKYRLIPTLWLMIVLSLIGVAYYFPLHP